MRVNKDFSIALKSLKDGVHDFEFEIKDLFFDNYESSPVKSADLEVKLDFHKRSDHLQLEYHITGWLASSCDRCTADIKLPFERNTSFILKYGEIAQDDGEVIYINVNDQHLDLSDMVLQL